MKKSCIPTLLKKPYLFRRTTTLSLDEFSILAYELEPEWKEREEARLSLRKRTNKVGQGRPYTLGSFDHLLLCALLFARTSVGYDLLGLFCGIDQSTVKRVVRRIMPLLMDRFIPVTELTPKKRRSNKLSDLLAEYPELADVIFDGTELPIKRPKRRQKQSYSGKKKRHTKKVQVALDKKTKLVLTVSPLKKGRIHDKKQLESTGWEECLPEDVRRSGDLGYQGMRNWKTPHKKPRGQPLTSVQKRENKRFAKERIVVEHGIRGMKMFHRIGETITQKTDEFLFTTVLAAANLYNFKRLVRQGLG